MTRSPHIRAIFRASTRIAPLVVGALAVGAAVGFALDRVWVPAVWALIAAVWAFLYAAHSCPVPPAPERGLQCVHFIGGPEDGGGGVLPGAGRDLHLTTVKVDGTDYRVGAVEQTCYTAELVPDREVAP